MTEETRVRSSGPGGRWWLPVLLALLILAIIAIAYYATHPHVFSSSPTATPTATATPSPTATPKTVTVIVTPTPGPTATPGGPPTPPPAPTPGGSAAGTLKTGVITHPQSQILSLQQGANRNDPADTIYLNPFQVVQQNLPAYGFTSFMVVAPPTPPAATPTPYTSQQGTPQVRIIVQSQGQKYGIFLDQPVQKGPKGIWVIIAIRPCAGTTYCTKQP